MDYVILRAEERDLITDKETIKYVILYAEIYRVSKTCVTTLSAVVWPKICLIEHGSANGQFQRYGQLFLFVPFLYFFAYLLVHSQKNCIFLS